MRFAHISFNQIAVNKMNINGKLIKIANGQGNVKILAHKCFEYEEK